MSALRSIGDGVFVRRYEPLDISIGFVVGADGVLLVDTRCNPREAEEISTDALVAGLGGIRWVVDTHAHYDHAFGNQVFAGTAELIGHARIVEHFRAFEAPRLAAWTADPGAQPQYDWTDVVLTPPTTAVQDRLEIDLGGRTVEVIPLPAGHTDTDVVVHVPDAGVWFAGDVIEESGPPMYGSGSFPLGWPIALGAFAAMIAPGEIVVPGHGSIVDRDFVLGQARVLGAVADAIRSGARDELGAAAVAADAAESSGLPFDVVAPGVARGLAELRDGV